MMPILAFQPPIHAQDKQVLPLTHSSNCQMPFAWIEDWITPFPSAISSKWMQVVWAIEQSTHRQSLKYQGIVSQMTWLRCVTKVILRVPNRPFFPRINLPSQMGQPAHGPIRPHRPIVCLLSCSSTLVKITCSFSALIRGDVQSGSPTDNKQAKRWTWLGHMQSIVL